MPFLFFNQSPQNMWVIFILLEYGMKSILLLFFF